MTLELELNAVPALFPIVIGWCKINPVIRQGHSVSYARDQDLLLACKVRSIHLICVANLKLFRGDPGMTVEIGIMDVFAGAMQGGSFRKGQPNEADVG